MNANYLDLFIIAMTVAVLIQLGILTALAISVRKTSKRMETLADQASQQAIPALAVARGILEDARPRLQAITHNLETTSGSVRHQMERLEATVDDALDRLRLQVIRTDDMTSRALDRVEETAEMVQEKVSTPARHFSGIMQGVAVGVEAYMRGNRRRRRDTRQDEEMFI
jgi:ABC-type transporter Mla subunit MlaD